MNQISKMPAPSPRLSKEDRGAIMFQTFFNKTREDFDRLDTNWIKLARAIGELKRRVDVLEESIKFYRAILRSGKTTIKFSCIACDYEFHLPQDEARVQNFTTICPKCYSWALPVPKAREYSVKDFIKITGLCRDTVLKTIRKTGLSDGVSGREQFFNEEKAQKILAILKTKRPYGKKTETEKEEEQNEYHIRD